MNERHAYGYELHSNVREASADSTNRWARDDEGSSRGVGGGGGMAAIEDRTWLEPMPAVACERHLRENQIGRLGLLVDGHPEIFPVNYTFVDGVIVIRVDPGTKLDAIVEHPSVAFEIDGTDEDRQNGWSVLVVGSAREVSDPAERQRLASRNWPEPWTGGAKDHVICIDPEKTTGRYLYHRVKQES